MSTGLIILIIVLVVVVAGAVVAVAVAGPAGRSRKLQRRFGPEYDRVLAASDSRRAAEAELTQREQRVSNLNLSPLTDEARASYTAQWDALQERFVEAPADATADAWGLVESVVRDLGYPDEGYEQTLADLSVNHGPSIGRLRAARDITSRDADTEELRVALLNYRELFSELLVRNAGESTPGPETAVTPSAAQR